MRIECVFQPTLTLDRSKVQPLELDAAQTAQVAERAPILECKPDVTKIDRIELRRRLIITLNMSRVIQHVLDAVRQENTERLEPVFDHDHPVRSTGEMNAWYTGKPCARTNKSHINVCVYDSTWESSDAFALENSDAVAAWVKNDHLGFEIAYLYQGAVRKYRPDFLVRLTNGEMLVLETKGEEDEQDRVKHGYLDEWVQAVNAHGGFGRWRWAVARHPGEIRDVLRQGEEARTEG